MFWNKVARLYDLFEITYNKKVYKGTGIKVADFINAEDEVLECACGTGAISVSIAPNCRKLIATDYSEGMLRQTKKKLAAYNNVKVEPADITALHYADNSFNKVVAGNVIHLLPNPKSCRIPNQHWMNCFVSASPAGNLSFQRIYIHLSILTNLKLGLFNYWDLNIIGSLPKNPIKSSFQATE